MRFESFEQEGPADWIKTFGKVMFEKDGWPLVSRACGNDFLSRGNTIKDRASFIELWLSRINKIFHFRVEAIGKNFHDDFENTMQQANGSKFPNLTCSFFFRYKSNVSDIDATQF